MYTGGGGWSGGTGTFAEDWDCTDPLDVFTAQGRPPSERRRVEPLGTGGGRGVTPYDVQVPFKSGCGPTAPKQRLAVHLARGSGRGFGGTVGDGRTPRRRKNVLRAFSFKDGGSTCAGGPGRPTTETSKGLHLLRRSVLF